MSSRHPQRKSGFACQRLGPTAQGCSARPRPPPTLAPPTRGAWGGVRARRNSLLLWLDVKGGNIPERELARLTAVAPIQPPVCSPSPPSRCSIGTQVMVRAELTAAIYRKALRLSTRARQTTETGRIVNHMSADVNTIQMFFYPFATQVRAGGAAGTDLRATCHVLACRMMDVTCGCRGGPRGCGSQGSGLAALECAACCAPTACCAGPAADSQLPIGTAFPNARSSPGPAC